MTSEGTQIAEYIQQEIIRRTDLRLDMETPLVSSGLIDSLALVQILLVVEDVTNRRIPAGKVQAKDMDTIALMLQTAERVGKPR